MQRCDNSLCEPAAAATTAGSNGYGYGYGPAPGATAFDPVVEALICRLAAAVVANVSLLGAHVFSKLCLYATECVKRCEESFAAR